MFAAPPPPSARRPGTFRTLQLWRPPKDVGPPPTEEASRPAAPHSYSVVVNDARSLGDTSSLQELANGVAGGLDDGGGGDDDAPPPPTPRGVLSDDGGPAGEIMVGWAKERPFRPQLRLWLGSARGLPNKDKRGASSSSQPARATTGSFRQLLAAVVETAIDLLSRRVISAMPATRSRGQGARSES